MWPKIKHFFRVLSFGLGFATFGVGGIGLAISFFPLIYITSFSVKMRKRRIRRTIQISFWIFILLLKILRIISVEARGLEKLKRAKKVIIVANHPSLIDIVLLISYIPQADCIIKSGLLRNPFFGYIVKAAYIPNSEAPEKLLEDCRQSLANENALIIFPEGTRTIPGKQHKLSRGAANIALRTKHDILPIKLSCDPPGLLKDQKWYAIPPETMNFVLDVQELIDINKYLVQNEQPSLSARRVTEEIQQVLF